MSALRAGMSLPQAIGYAADESPPPLGDELRALVEGYLGELTREHRSEGPPGEQAGDELHLKLVLSVQQTRLILGYARELLGAKAAPAAAPAQPAPAATARAPGSRRG